MIQIIDETRCTSCNICVHACPTNVFDAVPDHPPIIARQDDCQTCFMCELYCPEDALYVSPHAEGLESADSALLGASARLGSYRHAIGWSAGQARKKESDLSYKLLGAR